MSRLGGLWRTMPWTSGLFALGSVAVSGLPPLNGFVSEWLIYLGLFEAATGRGVVAWAAMPATILLAMGGALAMACFAKGCSMIFLGASRTKPAAQARECGNWMLGPMIGLAAACVVLGLVPALFWPAVMRAVGSWHPAWATMETPSPVVTLGPVQLAFAFLVLMSAACLWHKAHSSGLRRGLTWDCGYAAPVARMQYTGGSFAGIGAGWFTWVLQPVLMQRRPRGQFPEDAIRLERFPDTVLARIISPAGGVLMQVSTAVRSLQHGRLQFYILYVVAGMVALAILVLTGGVR